MTFPNDGTGVIKMRYSEDEISAVLGALDQERKRLQKQGKVMETLAAYRLKELQHFQAREQLATWRRTHGYDGDESWMHGTRPFSPPEFTASLWSDLEEVKDAISMSSRARPWQKAKDLLGRLEGDLPDEELAAIKRYVERRSREAAQVTVTPVSTVQHCITRSLTPGTSPDVRTCMESNEDKINPEPTELELSSAGRGFETPGQPSPPNGETWETGRTIADGYLLVSMGSNQGGDTSSPTERFSTRAGTATTPANSSSTIFRKASHKPRDKTPSEENKQFDPGGKGEKPPLWNAAVMVLSFFLLGVTLDRGRLTVFASSCLLLCACLSVLYSLFYQVITFSKLKNIRGDADQVADVHNRKASTFLPINPLKIITTVSSSMGRNALGIGLFDRSPGIVAHVFFRS